MQHTSARILLATLLAATLLGLSAWLTAAPALAQSAVLSPTSGPVGTSVTVTATGFAKSSILTATIDGVGVTTAPTIVHTDGAGAATFALLVFCTTAGAHTVIVSDGVHAVPAIFTVQPRVVIAPESGPVGITATVSGTGFAAGSTADILFTLNNSDPSDDVPIAPGVLVDSDGSFVATVIIPSVSGGGQVLLAVDSMTHSAYSVFVVGPDVRYWAVLVGISDYPGTANDLLYCRDDAEEVRDALLTSPAWSADNIVLLTDSDATAYAIMDAIYLVGLLADSNDVVLFYFSGHGDYCYDLDPVDEWDGWDEYLVPYDYLDYWILDDNLAQWLGDLPTAKVCVAIDTCFSGGMIRGSHSLGVPEPASRPLRPEVGDGFARDLGDVLQGVVLTACAEDEGSWSAPYLQNGVFTYYFIEALTGGMADANGNDLVSMEESFLYLYPRVSTYWLLPPYQHPQIFDNYPGELELLDLRVPQLPCRFHGSVLVDGAAVPDGTIVVATVEGDTYQTSLPSVYGNSTYCLMIEPPLGTCYADGADVTFSIGNTTAYQIGAWQTGANVELDLTANPTAGVFVLSSSSYRDTLGYLHVVGEVRNNTGGNVDFIKVVASFYDDGQDIVGTTFTYTEFDILTPLQRAPFEIVSYPDMLPDAESYSLQVSYQVTAEEPPTDLVVLSQTSMVDTLGYHKIVGEIENDGNTTVEFVKVVATYYDAEGEVMGTDFTFTELDELPPGESSPYEISSFPRQIQPASYSVQVQGSKCAPAPPQPPPCRFWGSVQMDGADVPVGTLVAAVIDGDVYETTTPGVDWPGLESTYSLVVYPQFIDYANGTEVGFRIANRTADQTSSWVSNGNVEVNLSTGTAPVPVIQLDEGWNLISLPVIPDDGRVQTLFSGLSAIAVSGYDAATETWVSWDPSPAFDDLQELVDGTGYWVYMAAPAALEVPGVALKEGQTPPSYDVCPGWNLIGFKSLGPKTASDYLAGVGKYGVIYGYEDGAFCSISDSDDLEPGCGYWLAVIEPGTIYP